MQLIARRATGVSANLRRFAGVALGSAGRCIIPPNALPNPAPSDPLYGSIDIPASGAVLRSLSRAGSVPGPAVRNRPSASRKFFSFMQPPYCLNKKKTQPPK
jgi:hypothetical protein